MSSLVSVYLPKAFTAKVDVETYSILGFEEL